MRILSQWPYFGLAGSFLCLLVAVMGDAVLGKINPGYGTAQIALLVISWVGVWISLAAFDPDTAPLHATSELTERIGSNAPAIVLMVVIVFVTTAASYRSVSPFGFLDPFFYTGIFTNFDYMLSSDFARGTYYVARMPWNLVGAAVHYVFSFDVAESLLNIVLYAVSAFSLYGIVRCYSNVTAGVSVAILMAGNTYFASSMLWDYPDGPSIAYAMLGYWLLLAPPVRIGRNLPVLLAGASFMAAGWTIFIVGLIIVPVVFAWLIFQRPFRIGRALLDMALLAAGGGLATILVGILTQLAGGEFLFFMPQINYLLYLFAGSTLDTISQPVSSWLPNGYRLSMLAVPLLGGLAVIVTRPRILWAETTAPAALFRIAFVAQVITLLLFVLAEFGANALVLQVNYHGTYMVAPGMLLMGALFALCPAGNYLERLVLIGVALALALFGAFGDLALPRFETAIGSIDPWITIFAIAGAGMVLIALARAVPLAAIAGVALVAGSQAYGTTAERSIHYVYAEKAGHNEIFDKSLRLLRNGVLEGRSPRFWYPPAAPEGNLYSSIASLYFWGFVDMDTRVDEGSDEELRNYVFDKTLIFFGPDGDYGPEGLEKLSSRGIGATLLGCWIIETEGVKMYVTAAEVSPYEGQTPVYSDLRGRCDLD
ncbi:MAG: hypothetical protein Rhirs2KO_13870 [Rhizobiaceae bacterium]